MSNPRKQDDQVADENPTSSVKGDRQRAEILRAAAVLFAEKGYHGTRTHHIAEAVNLSRTAVYFYFKNKEEILASLVDDVTYTLQRRSFGLVEQGHKPPTTILKELVVNYAELVMEMRTEFRFVSRTEADFPKDIAEAHDKAKRAVLENFVRAISRGVNEGSFRASDPTVVSLAIIGMCNWSAWWYREDGRMAKSLVAQHFSELALQMVGSQIRPESSDAPQPPELVHLQTRLAALEKIVLGDTAT